MVEGSEARREEGGPERSAVEGMANGFAGSAEEEAVERAGGTEAICDVPEIGCAELAWAAAFGRSGRAT